MNKFTQCLLITISCTFITIYPDQSIISKIYHYALNHHPKMLAGCGLMALLTTVGLITLHRTLKTNSPWIKRSVTASVGLLTALCCYRYVLPYFVKQQEKQADLLAAATLKTIGRQDVIDEHINNLKENNNDNDTDLWWYSSNQQVKYLEENLAEKIT